MNPKIPIKSPLYRLMFVIAGLAVAQTGGVHAEEGLLEPTPFATPEEAIKHAQPWGEAAKAEDPVDADVVGVITKTKDGKLGFMPELLHHMAVEHWFIEGIDDKKLKEAYAGTKRCHVRLQGKLTFYGSFGSEVDFYGNGLKHGYVWGPVMGYNERVYRLEVKEVVWARTHEEHRKFKNEAFELMKTVEKLYESGDYQGALERQKKVMAAAKDTGIDLYDIDEHIEYAELMVLLLSDPKNWNEEDMDRVARAVVNSPYQPFSNTPGNGGGDLKPKALARFKKLAETWPKATHEALGERVVKKAFMGIEYRHLREQALASVATIDSNATRGLLQDWKDAHKKIEELDAKLQKLANTGNYKAMLDILGEAAEPHALALDYKFEQAHYWADPARRLLAIQEAFDDPEQRMKVLIGKSRESITAKSGAGNSRIKPRFGEEIVNRFVPRLSEEEKSVYEAALLELLEPMSIKDDLTKIYITIEMLDSFAGEKGQAKIREIVKQMPWSCIDNFKRATKRTHQK